MTIRSYFRCSYTCRSFASQNSYPFSCVSECNHLAFASSGKSFEVSGPLHRVEKKTEGLNILSKTWIASLEKGPIRPMFCRFLLVSFYSSRPFASSRGPPSRSLRRRIRKRAIAAAKPVLNEAKFQSAILKLPPRFSPEDLYRVLTLQDDPLVCLELFNWASQQNRFRHDVSTFHIVIQKLGAAKMYEEMDFVVNQVLALPYFGSEAMYNTIIYHFTMARKLVRAVNIFNHMRNCGKFDCMPSIRTYNILFAAFLLRGKNTYVNRMYMEAIRTLFKQMMNDGIEPDTFALNSMIKGYVLSLDLNDALRIFHQMGPVFNCEPNSVSYNYLIHGLCARGRTNNAKHLCEEMKTKGYIPSSRSYNSLVNSLALGGEVDEATKFLWEMNKDQRSIDFITFKTLLDEICRQRNTGDASNFLKELLEKGLVDGHMYQKLQIVLQNGFQ